MSKFYYVRILQSEADPERFYTGVGELSTKHDTRIKQTIRSPALIMLSSRVTVSKIVISVAVGLALFGATVRLPATPCFVTNTPSEKACEPGCCANKACCATSHQRTEPPVQPLAKSPSDQQNVATVPAVIAFALPVQVATESRILSSAEGIAHSLPPLALTCICLI